ncbi:MAG: hypothetical protein ACLRZ9_07710 [Eubacterium sp.]
MNKTFKKVLSVVLSLAMIATSITVYNATAKADENVEITVSESPAYMIDATWSHPDVEYTSQAVYLNESDNVVEDEDHYAAASNGHCWTQQGGIITHADTVSKTKDGSVMTEAGGTFVITVVYYDADGTVVARGTSEPITIAEKPANTDLGLKHAPHADSAQTKITYLEWTPITGAAKYEIYDGDELIHTENNGAGTWTQFAITLNKEYNITVKAIDADGNEIEITNNTVTAIVEGTEDPTDPIEDVPPTFDDVDTTAWTKLDDKNGKQSTIYSMNTASYEEIITSTDLTGVFTPHSQTSYHGGTCGLADDAAALTVFANGITNAAAVWVNGTKYANGSDKFYSRNDSQEIALDLFTEEINYVAIVNTDGSKVMKFAVKMEAESDPTDNTVDISNWVEFTAKGAHKDDVKGKYYMNQVAYDTYVNTAIWGVVAVASETDYHGDAANCLIPGTAVTFGANGTTLGNAAAVWINGVKYGSATTQTHLRGDSVEISVDGLKEGVNYIAVVGAKATVTFAIKYVDDESETTPTVKPETPVGLGYAGNDDLPFYFSWGAMDADSFNFYVNGTLVDSVTGYAYNVGEKAAQLFPESGTYEIGVTAVVNGVESDMGTYSWEYTKAPAATYTVTVDGVEAATVEEGKTYTLGNAKYGYYSDGKMYKAGTDYTVTADVEFTSVTEDNLKVTAANGAGIRLTDPSGIRFQATIEADDTILASDVISEGTIITAKDIYDNNGSTLTLDSAYEKAVIPNSGWYNNQTGTYCGSLVNMSKSNYVREFLAVAYVTINYADGSATTIYSNMTGVRSVQSVAQAIIDKNDLAKFTAEQQALIAAFVTVN